MIRPRPSAAAPRAAPLKMMMKTLLLIAALILVLAAAPAHAAATRSRRHLSAATPNDVALTGAPCRKDSFAADGAVIPGDPACSSCTKVAGAGVSQQAISKSKATTCTQCASGPVDASLVNGVCTCPKGAGKTPGTGINLDIPATCSLCPVNTYSSDGQPVRTATCTACPTDTTAPAGSTSIDACTVAAGSVFTKDGVVVPCPAGSACGGGSITGAGALPTLCAAGSFAAAGASTCTPCAANSYASTAESASCTGCPDGTSTKGATGSTSASACVADGTYADGLLVSYYDLAYGTSQLPDFSQMTPIAGLPPTVPALTYGDTYGSFADSGRYDYVGAVFTGYLTIPTTGTWTIYLNSDDGSKLWLDGQLLITNDFVHPTVEISQTVELAAGRHAVRVEYFEKQYSSSLYTYWEGPSTAKQLIPASAWSHAV